MRGARSAQTGSLEAQVRRCITMIDEDMVRRCIAMMDAQTRQSHGAERDDGTRAWMRRVEAEVLRHQAGTVRLHVAAAKFRAAFDRLQAELAS